MGNSKENDNNSEHLAIKKALWENDVKRKM